MDKLPINDVLAANLQHFMKERGFTQTSLSKKSGVSQGTVANYLNPHVRRTQSKSGKPPSAKLTEVEKISEVLGVQVWELLRPITPQEREFYKQIEASFEQLRRLAQSPAAAAAPPPAPTPHPMEH